MRPRTYTVEKDWDSLVVYASNVRSLCRDHNGQWWVVFSKADIGSGYEPQIYVAYSANGRNWAREIILGQDSAYENREPSIAVDSKGNLHVAWTGMGYGSNLDYRNIRYCKRNSNGTWDSQIAVTDTNADQAGPIIAIDSGDNAHLAWVGQGWGANPLRKNVQYNRVNSAGSLGTQIGITDSSGIQYDPSIAVDLNDNVYIFWHGTGWGTYPTRSQIQYVKIDNDGTVGTQIGLTDNDYAHYDPSIAIDLDDNVHISWYGTGYGTTILASNIQYVKIDSSGNIGSVEVLTDYSDTLRDAQFNTISIDSANNPHIIWTINSPAYGDPTNLRYQAKIGGAWTTAQTITGPFYSPAGDMGPRLVSTLWPQVGGGRPNVLDSGKYAAVFFRSRGTTPTRYDLRFIKNWQYLGNIHIDQLYYQHAERMVK